RVAHHEVGPHDVAQDMFRKGRDKLDARAVAVAVDLGAAYPFCKADDLEIIVLRKTAGQIDFETGAAARDVQNLAVADGERGKPRTDGRNTSRPLDIKTLP